MQIMAKGTLDKVDLSQQQSQKGANLSYEGVQSPVQTVRPSAGLLKQVLSRSKESEQFSPYKKKEIAKPTKIMPQTATPSPEPVQAKPILTQDILEPIAPMEQRISKKPETTPAPKTPEKPFVSAVEPLEETRKMAIDFEGKVRDRINQIADAIYESPNRPDKAKDVWKEEIRTGMKDGSIHAVVDEQGNVDIKRKAPSFFEAFWEGQAELSSGIKEGIKYQFENDDEKKARLENNYKQSLSQIEEEQSLEATSGRVAGGVGGQILTQSPSYAANLIPVLGPYISNAMKAGNAFIMGLSQDLQSEQEAYNIAREQNLNIDDALDIAKKGKYTYLSTGIAENYVSNLIGGRLLKAGVAASTAGKGFINASKQFLRAAGSKSAELGLDGAVAASASVIRDARMEAVTGGDVDIKERALDNAIVEIAAGGALTGLGVIYGQGKQYLPKWFKSQSLNMASNLDETFVKNSLEEMQRNGQIDEAGVKTALEDIQKWNETKKNNPDIPEEKAPTLIGYFTQKQNLEESLKKADESSQPAILKKIEDINKKISEARTNPEPLATEQDDIIQEPIVKEEAKITEQQPINIDKAIKQKAKESPIEVAKAASLVFKDAGFHRGSLPGKSDYLLPGYLGEQPFTGYYFVSNPEDVVQGGSRFGDPEEFRIVDFSKYNLYKPGTEEYWETKYNLKKFVRNAYDFDKAYNDLINKINNSRLSPVLKRAIEDYNKPKELEYELYQIEQALDKVKNNRDFDNLTKRWDEVYSLIISQKGKDNFKEDLKNELEKWSAEELVDKKERFETIMLKMLGFEGVDVRGLKSERGTGSPDNFKEGSVIFDLKPETVQTLSGAYESAKSKGENPELISNIENIIKPKENATTISKGQEGSTTSSVSEYQGVEGEQAQTTNEADNRNRPISGKTQQEVEVEAPKEIPKIFNNDDGKSVFAKMNTAAENKLKKRPGNTRAASGEAVRLLKNSSWYKGLTDIQKDAAVRTAVKYFGEKVPSAPSVARLFGQIDKEITVKEKTALKRLMKFGEESATGAIEFSKATKESINQGLKELGKRGIIKVSQLNSILNKYNSVNVESEKSISKFVDFASNIIKDANYEAKLKEADGLRNAISRNANKKTTQVNLSNTAKEFVKLNPADVEDIQKYIDIAGNIFKGVKTSKSGKNLKVDFAQSFLDKNINEYTESQKAYIEESLKQQKMSDYQDLVDMGVISADMDFSEMEQIISGIEENSKKTIAKDKERNIRAYVNSRFNSLATMAESMINTGNDGFGVRMEDIDPAQKKRIKEIIDRGIEKMPTRDAYRIVEAFDNFITNGKTSGLDAIIKRYDGNIESENLYKAKVKARPLKLLFSNSIARSWAEAFDSIPIKLVRMFGSKNAPKVERAMGLVDLQRGKNIAIRTSFDTDKRFINDFEGKQANGDSYDSAYNVVEQGMLGFMRRNIGGNDQDLQNEFNRRKTLIEQTIDVLTNSNNDQDKNKAEIYNQAYEKVLANSNNISDVESKTDAVNKEVVNWWTNEWSKHYDKLRDVNINVYNQDLGKDNNYNPDVYKWIKDQEQDIDLFNNSGFSFQYDYIPQKQSGTLIKAERPSDLPKDKFIDLSFSKNNSRALKSALVDIYTAADIRKVDSFLKAETTAKMINKEDLALLRSSISDYIKRSRGMEGVDINEFTKLQRVISSAGRFVTSAALGSAIQPFKQTIPLIIKTMINTNGEFAVKESLALAVDSQSPVNKFLNDSGYGISIRGIESSTGITALDNIIRDANEGNFNKFMNSLDKWNEFILKYTVSNPDKWAARAAWVTYYKKALKDSGVDASKIDWSTHEVVPEAADYAQSMVDTQQNVSDRDLMGKFMGSKNATTAAARTFLMPFSGFIMNAKSKMQADMINSIKGSTKEERIASRKSLTGSIGEMLVFNAITGAVGIALWDSWRKYSGTDESERESEKKFEQAAKSATTNFVSDILSPFPQTNALINNQINNILDQIDPDTPDELKFRLYGDLEKPIYQDFGLLGIGAKKLVDMGTTVKEYTTGEFESEAFGKKTIKKISDEDREMLKVAAMMQALYTARIIPLAELATLSNKITRYVEKRALTEKQSAISQVVSEQKVEGATTKVNGEDISKALSKAVSYKDPETRANYLIQLEEQYKDDFVKALGLAEESKILDGPTAANFIAKKGGVQDEIDIARLFSYKDQKSRVYKLMKLREQAVKEGRLLEFYEGLKFGMQFKVFNKDGIVLYAQALDELVDQDSEEIDLLLNAIED